MKNAALSGKPYVGNPHVRFDEGEVASAKPRRGSLLYKEASLLLGLFLGKAALSAEVAVSGGTVGASRVVVNSGIATLDVPVDISPYTMVADDAAAILQTGVTEFHKTGAGTLVADKNAASIAAFAGTIRVKEGLYKVAVEGDLGKNGISVYVESGAAASGQVYVDNGTAAIDFQERKLYVAGEGPDQKGAVYFKNDGAKATLSDLTLTGDASVRVGAKGLTLNTTIDLQGHTLDLEPDQGFCVVQGDATVRNGGHIIFDKNKKFGTSGINWGWTYAPSEDATLTMGGYVNNLPDKAKTPWKWIVHEALNFRQNISQDKPWSSEISDLITNPDAYMYGGPVMLNAKVTHGNDSAGRWQITGFAGPVSGEGNITMVNAAKHNRTWFKLGSANPDWTGKIDVKRDYAVNTNGTSIAEHANGLALFADGALTQNTLELKNAELYLGGTDAVQHLPDIETEGYGRFWGSGAVTGLVDTLTKKGGDVLLIESDYLISNLVVQAGTVRLPSATGIYASVTSEYTYARLGLAGLAETAYLGGTTYETKVRPHGAIAGWFDGNNNPAYVDSAMQSALVDYKSSGPGYDDNTKWWNGRAVTDTFTYDGYVWNHSDQPVTWGFMSCVNSKAEIYMDDDQGNLALLQTGKSFSSTNDVINAYAEYTLKPGANRIRIVLTGKQGCSSGANIASELGESGDVRPWSKTRALCYDPTLENLLRGKQWTKTCYTGFNPLFDTAGKGEFFTTVAKTRDEILQERRDEICAKVESQLTKIVNATFAEGTIFNLGGLDQAVAFPIGSVSGFPHVTGGNLRVTRSWTLDAAAVLAGQKVVSDGQIEFAPGAKIVIRDGKLRSQPDGVEIMAAAGGIVGTPALEFVDHPERASYWTLENRNGKLYLKGGLGLLLIVR